MFGIPDLDAEKYMARFAMWGFRQYCALRPDRVEWHLTRRRSGGRMDLRVMGARGPKRSVLQIDASANERTEGTDNSARHLRFLTHVVNLGVAGSDGEFASEWVSNQGLLIDDGDAVSEAFGCVLVHLAREERGWSVRVTPIDD